MENNPQQNIQKVSVNANKIISKFRNIQDRVNYCLEHNWYHPSQPGYDASFFLKVLAGEKRYMPNDFTINYKIPFYRKGEKLDKDYLISKMKGNDAYVPYTPDTMDPKRFSKQFLLTLIAYLDSNLFKQLYSINKDQSKNKFYNSWNDFQVNISSDLIKDIDDFQPVASAGKRTNAFRKTKNHINTNVFHPTAQNAGTNSINKPRWRILY